MPLSRRRRGSHPGRLSAPAALSFFFKRLRETAVRFGGGLLWPSAILLIAGGAYQGYRYFGPVHRQIDVCVVTDFSFRDQKPNNQFALWFAEVNRIFEPTGVTWNARLGGEAYPEGTQGTLAERRDLVAENTCKADVVLGFTAEPDRRANSSVIPFEHAALVAVTAADSDAMAISTVSRALAKLFGSPISTGTLVQLDAPQSEGLDPGSLKLVTELRNYDFSRGLDALTGRWERKAAAALRDSLTGRRENPEMEARRVLARAMGAARRHSAATEQLREAVRLAPGNSSVRFELAMALQEDSQSDDAVSELRRVAQADPEDARPHAAAGAILLNRNRMDEAIDELRTAARLDSGNAAYQSALGKALSSRVGHTREAAAAIEASLRLNPTDQGTLGDADRVRGDQSVLSEAVAQLQAESRQKPGSAEVHLKLGLALAAAGDYEDAIRAIERAVAIDGSSGVAHLALARVHYLKREYAQARSELENSRRAGVQPGLDFINAVDRKLATR